jgi:hypothetical protein
MQCNICELPDRIPQSAVGDRFADEPAKTILPSHDEGEVVA